MNAPEYHDEAAFQVFAKDGLLSLTVRASGKVKCSLVLSFADATALGRLLIESARKEESP